MSGTIKCVIIGVVIAVLGVVAIIVALGINGWNLDEQFDTQISEFNADMSDLQLNIDDCTLNVNFYSGEKLKVEYECNNRVTVKFENKQNCLTIKQNCLIRGWGSRKGLRRNAKMNVSIPTHKNLNLNLNLNAGTANIASGKFGKFTGVLNAGVLNFENIESDNFDWKINAGNVKIQNINTKNTNFNVNAGDVKWAMLACDTFKLKINAGKFLLKDASCIISEVTINAGDCDIENIALDDLNLNVNAGNADITIAGKKSEYNIDVKNSGGNCNIGSQSGTSSNKIVKVDLDCGSVHLGFGE